MDEQPSSGDPLDDAFAAKRASVLLSEAKATRGHLDRLRAAAEAGADVRLRELVSEAMRSMDPVIEYLASEEHALADRAEEVVDQLAPRRGLIRISILPVVRRTVAKGSKEGPSAPEDRRGLVLRGLPSVPRGGSFLTAYLVGLLTRTNAVL